MPSTPHCTATFRVWLCGFLIDLGGNAGLSGRGLLE